MEFLDARRITGPGLLWDKPGSILDIRCTPREEAALLPVWQRHVTRMLVACGWGEQETCHWSLSGGVSLAFSAPIDALYAASAINEWAWAASESELSGKDAPDFDEAVAEIKRAIEEEANPQLLMLAAAARENGVSFLWDDDDVSVGLGKGSETWPFRELPDPGSLDWSRYHDVPVGLVTGTNGKTTTVRLAQHILGGSNRMVGLSSTDWIAVNQQIIDRGDWSGPGGARTVLRQAEVDIAILETARGGLLRRGLGVDQADAALITNIAEDHLGDFGSQNLHEILDIKWIVSRAVEDSGVLILNADDPLLVGKSAEFPGDIVWFSLDARNAVVDLHVQTGGLAFVLDGADLVRVEGDDSQLICASEDIPIALGGAARHNVANALSAAALTDALGISLADIRHGLTTMLQDENPGRSNVYSFDGIRVLVDFAHNPHAMQSLFAMARALPAERRLLAFGQAGDRTDDSIRELARSAWSIGLDAVIISELEQYARGREQGVVFRIIKDELVRCGARQDQIRHFMEETESLDAALEWAQQGDLIIMLALGSRQEIIERLATLAA
jgi:UDP-N-acetylmuramyl tripeptide synthase